MKSAVGRAITYGVATLVPRAIGFALLPVYAHNMTPADYGLLATIDVFSTYLSITINAGFSNAFLRFYHDEDTDTWRSTTFLTCLCAAFLLGIAGVGLMEAALLIGASHALLTPTLHGYLSVATLTVFLEVINGIVWTLYRLEQRAPRAMVIALSRAAIAIPVNIYLIAYLKLAVFGFLISNLAVAIVVLCLYSGPEIAKHWAKPNMALLPMLMRFSLPYIPIGFIEALLNAMGVICLNLAGGLTAVGLFAIGSKISSIITLSYAPINTVWTPMMYERVKRADGREFYSESTSYVLIFLATTLVGVVTLGGPLLIAMTPGQYSDAAKVIIPLSVGTTIYSLRTNVRIGFTLVRKTSHLPFYTAVPIAIGFPVTTALAYFTGIVGAALGVAGTMIGTIIITGWRSQEYFQTSYQWNRILRLALVVSVCVFLASVIPSNQIIPRACIVILYFGLLLGTHVVRWADVKKVIGSIAPDRGGMVPKATTD